MQQQPVTAAAPASSTTSSRSDSRPPSTGPVKLIKAEFQVFDANGQVEIRQDADGRIFIPGRSFQIGKVHGKKTMYIFHFFTMNRI